MKRTDLLQTNLTEEKNVTTVIATAVAADKKFLKRAKRDLEDEIEDLKESLNTRLSSTTPIDRTVIEQTYGQLKEKEQTLILYKEFENEFLTESTNGASA